MSLTEQEKKYLQKWSKTIERGKLFYIITYGLIWGILLAVFTHLISSWGKTDLIATYFTSDFLIRFIAYTVSGGALFTFFWNFNYKKYKELKTRQGSGHTGQNTLAGNNDKL